MLRFPYVAMPLRRPAVTLGGGLVRHLPLLDVGVDGPTASRVLRCRVDTGADDTIFPEWLAQQIGLDLSVAPVCDGRNASGAAVQYRCVQVTLRISDGIESCSWQAMVGFLASPRGTGLLGLAGFLEHFDATARGRARELTLVPLVPFPGVHVVH
jgi:hypothetical protein